MPVGFIPQGDEFQVNTYTADTQRDPSITALADGGFVVTWESSQDGSGQGIYGQRYGADGATVGDEFLVNTETSSSQRSPSVTALVDGGFVVTWESNDQDDNGGYGVFGQRYDVSGATVGGEFQVNTETANEQNNPYVTALADGGFVVTWTSNHNDGGSSFDVFAQRYDATGAAVGNEFQVNTFALDDQQSKAITALADGGFVVTWHSSGQQDGSGRGIYGQRYGADGTTVGREFQVNTETANEQTNPSITTLADGGFVVTWMSADQDGSGYGIYGQRYSADGVAAGDEFQVNTETTNDQAAPSITALADGGFVVTWRSDGQDGDGNGVYGQRYDADGATVGDEFQVNTETTSQQSDPSITALADGGFVVTWQSSGQDGSGTGVFAQQFAAQYFGNDEDEEITGSAVDNWIYGRDGDDVLNGKKGADTLYGDDGQDILKGAKGKDMLYGGADADVLIGGKGADILEGGAGADVLKGGKGKDILAGGAGKDELFGGKGADVFVFSANEGLDVIRDFKDGVDKIDLSGFGFLQKGAALSHFFELGSKKNDVVGFEYDGTSIRIEGLDLGDINGADIII